MIISTNYGIINVIIITIVIVIFNIIIRFITTVTMSEEMSLPLTQM